MSIPASHCTWQPRLCLFPFIVTRHSKQIPIPQSGPRASPVTDVRQGSPEASIDAATLVPAGTVTCLPFNRMVMFSDMAWGSLLS
jgi:hypothetical protein